MMSQSTTQCLCRHFIMWLFLPLLFIGCQAASDESITNGDNTSGGVRSISLSGVTQKGPFITGTQVTISELDSTLLSTGMSHQTQIKDDLGNFSIDFTSSGSYGEYIASGYYYNETTGALSDAPLTLRAIAGISDTVNINILTTLQIDRVKALIGDSLSYSEAIAQSHAEILSLFGISSSSVASFDSMDISEQGASNSILLAISASLQQGRSVAEMSELISRLSLDLADNGVIDNQTLIDSFMQSALDVDYEYVCEQLEARYRASGYTITIDNFATYLDAIWSDGPTASFECNGGSEIEPQVLTYSNPCATEPTPIREGYTFDGWYADSLLSQAYDFTTIITSDVTLYAAWIVNYIVTLDSQGGEELPSQEITDGLSASEPSTTPIRKGYTFDGWYTSLEYTQLFDFATPITQDITIYAAWIINYTLSFDSGGGDYVTSQEITDGLTASEPTANPTRSGYSFDGWYTSLEYTQLFDFATPITQDITIYARWIKTSGELPDLGIESIW